jgi:Fe-S cluster assembly protein SufD
MDREGRGMTAAGDRLVARWHAASLEAEASRSDAPWLRALRDDARSHLQALGLPHRKLEAWRHTSLGALEAIDWSAPEPATRSSTPPSLDALAIPGADTVHVVDGRVVGTPAAEAPWRSIASVATPGGDADGLGDVLGRLADTKSDAFAALNTAFLADGVGIEIPRGAERAAPIHVVFATAEPGRLACPRLAVVARAGSRALLVLEHASAGDGPRLTSFVGEIVVEENARLDVVVVQREGDESFLVTSLATRQARDARLAIHTLTLGGRFVRNGVAAALAEPGAEIDLRGLFLGAGDRLVDNHTVADHAMPHTVSRELYKGVLGDASHGVFCGRVIVRPDAQKIDSSQSNPNLLLGARAEIDTQPQLEIYADDVKCSHGSTIGRLDDEALFYLRSRGIGAEAARVMLTHAFAQEIVDGLPEGVVRDGVSGLVEHAFARAAGGAR